MKFIVVEKNIGVLDRMKLKKARLLLDRYIISKLPGTSTIYRGRSWL